MTHYLDLLQKFIRFKSISTDKSFAEEIDKTANWLIELFADNGFTTEKIEGYGNPIVLAEYTVDSKAETVLIYGHYDVQPAKMEDGWDSDPFEVFDDGNKLFARGIVDNKGQVLVHIASVLELIKEKKLKYNVKFLIEGDEETGSPEIEKFFADNTNKLSCDFIVVSDGELTGKHACLDTSFRGIANIELIIQTSKKDNHSGLYGGSMPNAAAELSRIIGKMYDTDGNLSIEGINNSKNLEASVLENNKGIPYSAEEFTKITGAKVRLNEGKMDFYTQTGFLTSAEVTTLKSGYLDDGFRNAVPGKASAKINFRLAPDEEPKKVLEAVTNFVKKNIAEYAEFEIKNDQASKGFFVDTENIYCTRAKELLEDSYNATVFYRPCGAIIPIAGLFIEHVKSPLVMVGLGNEDCNMHGANENFDKEALEKGLEFSRRFFGE